MLSVLVDGGRDKSSSSEAKRGGSAIDSLKSNGASKSNEESSLSRSRSSRFGEV